MSEWKPTVGEEVALAVEFDPDEQFPDGSVLVKGFLLDPSAIAPWRTADQIAAMEAVIEGLLALEPLFDVQGAWDAKEQAIRNLASKARDALRAMEKPS